MSLHQVNSNFEVILRRGKWDEGKGSALTASAPLHSFKHELLLQPWIFHVTFLLVLIQTVASAYKVFDRKGRLGRTESYFLL